MKSSTKSRLMKANQRKNGRWIWSECRWKRVHNAQADKNSTKRNWNKKKSVEEDQGEKNPQRIFDWGLTAPPEISSKKGATKRRGRMKAAQRGGADERPLKSQIQMKAKSFSLEAEAFLGPKRPPLSNGFSPSFSPFSSSFSFSFSFSSSFSSSLSSSSSFYLDVSISLVDVGSLFSHLMSVKLITWRDAWPFSAVCGRRIIFFRTDFYGFFWDSSGRVAGCHLPLLHCFFHLLLSIGSWGMFFELVRSTGNGRSRTVSRLERNLPIAVEK